MGPLTKLSMGISITLACHKPDFGPEVAVRRWCQLTRSVFAQSWNLKNADPDLGFWCPPVNVFASNIHKAIED